MTRATRQMRADAVRNHQKIMDAARRLVTQHGPDAGMDAIAAEAGVAVGTLYRNFPTKADLVRAVVGESADAMAADVEETAARVRDGARVRSELVALAGRVIDSVAADAAVKTAAANLGGADYAEQERRALAALDCLIATAHAEGVVRDGITPTDFAMLVTTAPADQPKAVRDRWLQIFLAGIMT